LAERIRYVLIWQLRRWRLKEGLELPEMAVLHVGRRMRRVGSSGDDDG
jgi:hypothetical protein